MKTYFFTLLGFVGYVIGTLNQCERMASEVNFVDRNTIVDTSLRTIKGTWLSEGCETRPGPEYLLRNYVFKEDGLYKLIQHHYWDDSCSLPKFTVISHGQIKFKRNTLLNLDASTGYRKTFNITIIPQGKDAVKWLSSTWNKECPGQRWEQWKRYEEHLVYSNSDQQNFIDNMQHYPLSIPGYLICLSFLKWIFNELKLVKVQLRPTLNSNNYRMELLLGDIHPRIQENYTPTAFQTPLLFYNRDENEARELEIRGRKYSIKERCTLCGQIVGNEQIPPHLNVKPHLHPYIWGDWISSKCESWPMGLFLHRKFSFLPDDFVWIGEHRFYSDPFCTFPKFTITATGRFVFSGRNDLLKDACNIDFKIEKATLVIFTKNMARDLSLTPGCGVDEWKIGEVQDLTPTGGCALLGVNLPSTQLEIVKMDMNYQGAMLLYLGQTDLEILPYTQLRPTSYQEPLIKCGNGKLPRNLNLFLDDSDSFEENCGNVFSTKLIWFALLFLRFLSV